MFKEAINNYLHTHGYESIDLKAVLFDMDGVLFDSMPNHAEAWHKIMKRFGFGLSREEAYMHEGRTGASTINIVSRRERGHDATEEEINSALKTARLYDFVKGLKDGLLTDVGQAGSALSGGQKQRLALARVILADRPMIIFDEATSNIDVESEESIWEAIYELSKDKTILVISHRLANVKDAKNIYVMNKGLLVESGTHEELMNKESHYYNMVNKQNELEMIREVC